VCAKAGFSAVKPGSIAQRSGSGNRPDDL